MATYEESGVNIELGDESSRIAYEAAKATFSSRAGMIGEPVQDDGGFAGLLNMGDFYLVQNDDGIGTKMIIAEKAQNYDTMGYDLLAMVTDDAVCLGAEPVSISNTLDVNKVDPQKVSKLMAGLQKACIEHKVVIPGGEIAELGVMTNGYIWNATLMGVVSKDKLITGKNIKPGDQIIGLKSSGLRSNGFSLVRHILKEKFGEHWTSEKFDENQTWGEATLTPSKIYSSAILEMHGRHGQPAQLEIKGIVHVTGGGIPGNLPRLLKKHSLGANLHSLPEPHEMIRRLIEAGNVDLQEAYRTWNMGVGMILIANDFEKISQICSSHNIEASIIGEVTETPNINLGL